MHTVFQSMHQKYVVLNKNSSVRFTFAYSVLINISEVCGVKQIFFSVNHFCIQCSNQSIRNMRFYKTILQRVELVYTVFYSMHQKYVV